MMQPMIEKQNNVAELAATRQIQEKRKQRQMAAMAARQVRSDRVVPHELCETSNFAGYPITRHFGGRHVILAEDLFRHEQDARKRLSEVSPRSS